MNDQSPPAVTSLTLSRFCAGGAWRLQLPHERDHHLVVFLARGQGRCVVNGRRRGLSTNSVLFVPAHALMSLEIGRQSYGEVVQIPPSAHVAVPTESVLISVRTPPALAELTLTLDALRREQAEARPHATEALEAHAALLSIWMRRMLRAERSIPRPRDAHETLAAAYSAMVSRDYRTARGVPELAHDLGVSPQDLSASLERTSGLAPEEVLAGRRLHEARAMLEDGRLPVGLIADMLGFGGAAPFSSFIQKHTGALPDALRGPR
ncbi:AraC family transcriptional regulator [Pseudooceanicola sp. CBS1P-1]|uniref:Helix-turn-helix domain-containing protein n=1 Tax=Pseudooceanicola albus TaxID=2692189 RepID=A0A6L7FWL8_9RHOB|nr:MULTISPECIES: helix-turn-helix transcriptional regulator [Pseudooceanicola]MBT9383173.1 AraC family transcriptional regulator [Pseudooceanicola endophyticus]MXN16504.1 helix-turn-helix domain-containing protein [Pseudooceanicola albus]